MAEPDTLTRHQLRHQAEFAAKVFGRLAEYDFQRGLTDTPVDLSIERLRSNEDILTELHSTLLPLLRKQIIDLFDAMWMPNRVPKTHYVSSLNLKLVIEIQPKLELNLDRINRIIDDIIPGRIHESSQICDQHFKQFKCYRLRGLDRTIREEMNDELATFFLHSRWFVETVPPPVERQVYQGSAFVHSLKTIDAAITWSKGSELHIIYDYWHEKLQAIDTSLDDLFVLADPENERQIQPIIQLSQSFVPLIKLSKIFFKKIASEGMDKNNAPLFTEMSSHQLTLFENTVGEIEESVFSIVCSLEDSDEYSPNFTVHLNDKVKALISQFQSCLLLVDLYIVPLFTEINVCSSQSYFKTWIVTWNTLLSQATHKAFHACKLYRTD
ncbi:hypothetical protein PGT21_035406 [Puccinia graminis f. sp. tritici]|uniref:Uncharacterized protein n=2 Tax=Puccinia graminis f. sp. tritici TaxID=56615 RepID=E3K5Z4_PUCGT|nr:uncharacterized protein PGTG_05886 [Puccinia graminis f. sp. tritici CRL 75-36-700-3]EFP79565.2 hypothetical protein PGTG_05886 [Puccinia graminis f. sp. tritici CRL 75-36-700-3]KAA1109565.1 hypothetical protein PGTUg99_021365 [Puccinia graminis f. sp. tritici]KAA1119851.1 hypothetical protein PGT21_035406 [Puccinia graminis f. sp. tritici]